MTEPNWEGWNETAESRFDQMLKEIAEQVDKQVRGDGANSNPQADLLDEALQNACTRHPSREVINLRRRKFDPCGRPSLSNCSTFRQDEREIRPEPNIISKPL